MKMTEMAEGQNLPPVGRWGLTQPIHCLLVTELGTCERCLFDTFQLLAKCWCWISAERELGSQGCFCFNTQGAPTAGDQDDKHSSRYDYALKMSSLAQCTMCCLYSMFSFQLNRLRHILKFMSWYIIQHIFVPACSIGGIAGYSWKFQSFHLRGI